MPVPQQILVVVTNAQNHCSKIAVENITQRTSPRKPYKAWKYMFDQYRKAKLIAASYTCQRAPDREATMKFQSIICIQNQKSFMWTETCVSRDSQDVKHSPVIVYIRVRDWNPLVCFHQQSRIKQNSKLKLQGMTSASEQLKMLLCWHEESRVQSSLLRNQEQTHSCL